MSVEKETRKALRRAVWWRLLGDGLGLFVRRPLFILSAAFQMLGAGIVDLERAIMYYEIDAARRYKSLTGLDLAYGAGDAARYHGLDPRFANRFHNVQLGAEVTEGEDEDDA
jgi:hypothetical protein